MYGQASGKHLSLANFFHDPLGLVANLSAILSLSFFDQFWVKVVALNIALRYEIEAGDVIERGKKWRPRGTDLSCIQ